MRPTTAATAPLDAAGRRSPARRTRAFVALGAVAALTLTACSNGSSAEQQGGGGEETSAENVTLDFTWWGDASRAERYEEAVALFEERNPNIDVRTSYASFGDYWTARNTEAAASSLPDVIQMDIAYLTEYAEGARIAPLDEYLGEQIDVSTLPEALLPAAQLDGVTYGIPTSSNTLATIVNTDLLAELGLEVPAGDLTWDEYDAFLSQVAQTGASQDPPVYGSVDYTQIFWLFQIWLGQQGKSMFTEDGQLGFDESDLAEWWGRGEALREAGAVMPPDRHEQLEGVDAIGAQETASEISWDNFLVRFSEGAGGAAMAMLPPPADDPANRGLFLKPSLMLSISATSEHPAEAAQLVDFLINDPEVGEIFGMSRGVPASSSALEGFEPEGLDAQILEYEQSLEQYLTSSPPPPVAGFGTLEQAFVRITGDLAHDAVSLEDAVAQWFTEAESALAG
jgi:multiple sugar transport system substrate-binding protein